MLDYATLRVIWWLILGLLWIGFVLMESFSFGVMMWLPWLYRTEIEKRCMMNSIAPLGGKSQIGLILIGGALGIVWPVLFTLTFSVFGFLILIGLLALIFRHIGLKPRLKSPVPLWQRNWDGLFWMSGIVPPLVLGIVLGNVLQGVPFHFDEQLKPLYTGNGFRLLNPFALSCGLLAIVMFGMHGACYLALKTEGHLQARAKQAARITSCLTGLIFIMVGWIFITTIDGYVITSALPVDSPSNPLYKTVYRSSSAWFLNFQHAPFTLFLPISVILGSLCTMGLLRYPKLAMFCSGVTINGIIGTAGICLFPFLLPSSTHPNHSLVIWDSSAHQSTLWITLLALLFFMPILLGFTTWVSKMRRGKIRNDLSFNHGNTVS